MTTIPDTVVIPDSAENVRVLPTNAAQGALFRVGGYGKRRMFENEALVTGGGMTITYSGLELRSDDLDVFMAIFHFARGALSRADSAVGRPVQFNGMEMLRKLGWPGTGHYYAKLVDCMDRLQRASVRITPRRGGQFYQGNLVANMTGATENMRRSWVVSLDHQICSWLALDPLSIDWDERSKLTKPMGKWLHAFVSSLNATVFQAPLSDLMRHCGSRASSVKVFRPIVIEALEQMLEEGVIHRYKIEDGVVYIARTNVPLPEVSRLAATEAFQMSFDMGEASH